MHSHLLISHPATKVYEIHAETDSSENSGRELRQTSNPACQLPQYALYSDWCTKTSFPQRIFFTKPYNSSAPDWQPSKYAPTCAKIICDTNSAEIQSGYIWNGQYTLDSRCYVSGPTQAWTRPAVDGCFNAGSADFIYPQTLASVIYCAAPANAVLADVDPAKCYAGSNNATVARQIQCDLGLRTDCNSTAPSPSITPAPSQTQAIVIRPTVNASVPVNPNPACALPQYALYSDWCTKTSFPQRIFFTKPYNSSAPDWQPSKYAPTCAKIICDTNSAEIQSGYIWNGQYTLDSRCYVSGPTQAWTRPAVDGCFNAGSADFIYPQTLASVIYCAAPANAVLADVDPAKCYAGSNNATVARQIQCDLGLRTDCNSTAPSPSITPAPSQTQAIVIRPTVNASVSINPNPACALPQYALYSDWCTKTSFPQRIFFTKPYNSSAPDWQPSKYAPTCAKIVCDTNRADIQAGYIWNGQYTLDSRCYVSGPTQAWTRLAVDGCFNAGSEDFIYPQTLASVVYCAAPANAVLADVDPAKCYTGSNNATVARQIQCDLGLRTDCNSTAPSPSITPAPSQTQAIVIRPTVNASVSINHNPACALPQYALYNDGCTKTSFPQRIFFTKPYNSSAPDWQPGKYAPTCAKIICDTNSADIQTGYNWNGQYYLDSRCYVSGPTQAWTRPAVDGCFNAGSADFIYPQTVASVIYCAAPANAVLADVDPAKCYAGSNNATVARQIQCDLGLRTDCNSTAPSPSITPAQSQTQAIVIRPTVNATVLINPNPACALPQYALYNDGCTKTSFPQRIFFTMPYNSSAPDWQPGKYAPTCAKIICDTNSADIQTGYNWNGQYYLDSRCYVSGPTQAWTRPAVDGCFNAGSADFIYPQTVASVIYCAAPANAVLADVDPAKCYAGSNNATVARQIQCDLGLRSDCNSTAPSPSITPAPSQTQAIVIRPTVNASVSINPNPACALPQYALYNDGCTKTSFPQRIFFTKPYNSSAPDWQPGKNAPTCAKIICDTNSADIQTGYNWNGQYYLDSRCYVSGPTQAWTRPAVDGCFNAGSADFIYPQTLASVVYCAAPANAVLADVDPAKCYAGSNNATVARQIQCDLGLRTNCNFTAPSPSITPAPSQTQAIVIRPTVNASVSINPNPACALPQYALYNDGCTKTSFPQRIFFTKPYNSSAPDWQPGKNAPTCAKIMCDTNSANIQTGYNWNGQYYLDSRCYVSGPTQAWTRPAVDGCFNAGSADFIYPQTVASVIYCAAPANAVLADVDPAKCYAGSNNATVARQIQCDLGLRTDCNSTAPSPSIPPAPSQTQAIVIRPTVNATVLINPNPACALPQYALYNDGCTKTSFPQRIFFTKPYNSSAPDWQPGKYAPTCAKIICDTNSADIQTGYNWNGQYYLDSRCYVSGPTQAWTRPAVDDCFNAGSADFIYPQTLASVVYCAAPANAVLADVDPAKCYAGSNNATVARQIQCDLGLRTDCNSTAPSPSIPPAPSQTQAIVIRPTVNATVLINPNPACALPQYALYNDGCTKTSFPQRIFFTKPYNSSAPDWQPGKYAPTCAKIICDTNSADIQTGYNWNGQYYLDSRCYVSGPTQAWTRPAVDGCFNAGSADFIYPQTLASVIYCAAPANAVLADVDPAKCYAGSNNATVARQIQCDLGLRTDCNSTAPSPSITPAPSQTQAIVIRPTVNASVSINPNPACALPQYALYNDGCTKTSFPQRIFFTKPYNSSAPDWQPGKYAPTCAKIICDTNSADIQTGYNWNGQYYLDSRCYVSGPTQAWTRPAVDDCFNAGSADFIYPQTLASVIYCAAPANAVLADVDPAKCYAGSNNATVARQILCDLGLRTDCNSTAPSPSITPAPSQTQAIAIRPTVNASSSINPNPACALPQFALYSDWCTKTSFPQRVFFTKPYNSSAPDWQPSKNAPTCAKIICDTTNDDIQAGPIWNGQYYLDSRCYVSGSTDAWTSPASGCGTGVGSADFIYPQTLASVIYCAAPANAVLADVDPAKCYAGSNNATVARQIQCDLGLRTDCNSTTPLSSITPAPSPTHAMVVLPTFNASVSHNHLVKTFSVVCASNLVAVTEAAASVSLGLLSSLTPDPTAAIAAVPTVTAVSGLVVGFGLFSAIYFIWPFD